MAFRTPVRMTSPAGVVSVQCAVYGRTSAGPMIVWVLPHFEETSAVASLFRSCRSETRPQIMTMGTSSTSASPTIRHNRNICEFRTESTIRSSCDMNCLHSDHYSIIQSPFHQLEFAVDAVIDRACSGTEMNILCEADWIT